MSVEDESSLLSIVREGPLGVRELAKKMRRKTQSVVSLIKKMVASGLVEMRPERTSRRGRPRQVISMTALGEDYLKTFNELRIKPLRSSKSDLMRAKRDAEYVNRLIDRGKDPYKAFIELNSIVRDSRDSA